MRNESYSDQLCGLVDVQMGEVVWIKCQTGEWEDGQTDSRGRLSPGGLY